MTNLYLVVANQSIDICNKPFVGDPQNPKFLSSVLPAAPADPQTHLTDTL